VPKTRKNLVKKMEVCELDSNESTTPEDQTVEVMEGAEQEQEATLDRDPKNVQAENLRLRQKLQKEMARINEIQNKLVEAEETQKKAKGQFKELYETQLTRTSELQTKLQEIESKQTQSMKKNTIKNTLIQAGINATGLVLDGIVDQLSANNDERIIIADEKVLGVDELINEFKSEHNQLFNNKQKIEMHSAMLASNGSNSGAGEAITPPSTYQPHPLGPNQKIAESFKNKYANIFK
jgi:hypothetical protein